MRNPNGFGGVTKMSGNRRNPYRARVTVGWDENNKQQFKTIGYFAKRKEALEALAAYNANPAVFNNSIITFAEVYDKWSEQKYQTISDQNVKGYKAAYAVCDSIKNLKMADIKAAHLQAVVDASGKNYPTLKKIKTMMSQLYDYAMQNDIVNKNYAKFVDIKKGREYERKLDRTPFTEEEIETLWMNLGRMEWIDTILIQIYTGCRIGELLDIKSADVNVDEKYMRGGLKTKSGKNRVMPLHERIVPLISKRLGDGYNFLVSLNGGAVSYFTYRDTYWAKTMEQLKMSHLPHDCRHTFASRADTVGMNKLCIKRIMGHKSQDITDQVYTHKEIEELITEVNKLK